VVRTLACGPLIAGLVLTCVGAAAAQPPEGMRPPMLIIVEPPPPGAPRSSLAVRERLLSFDIDKDLRISRDELPERMQGLIARGDKNGNGLLDFDEIEALVTATSAATRVFVRPQPSEGLPGVISDLKLSPAKRERALAMLSVHRPAPHVKGGSNADLYKAMRSLLDNEEYADFVAASERLSKTASLRMGIID